MNSLWEFAKDVAQTQKALAEANEGVSHELTPEEVDDYARTLEKAQRQNPYFNLIKETPGDF